MISQMIISSPIGNITVSGNGNEICCVKFGEDLPTISSDSASIIVEQCAKELQEYFAGTRTNFSVLLRQTGTDFQQKVWEQLTSIPFGVTCSYSELAQLLGDKRLVRAVGNANSKNNIAILIPCHRVIGSSGNLVGYAGELWRKHWLLAHEKSINGIEPQLSFL
jgi:methylated-DNA-[protein]-cysteine S-methyltransferase